MSKNPLTAKQACFVQEYLIDLNATQAAIRAGYSKKTAGQMGNENLKKPKIANAIAASQKKRAERTEITQDRVLAEYAKLAFLDPRKFFTAEGNLVPIQDLDDDTAAALAGMDVVENRGEGGAIVDYTKKIKISDKKGALDSIARHLGMFNDKLDLTTGGKEIKSGVLVVPGTMTEKEWEEQSG
jgi:phage terminase small subunit